MREVLWQLWKICLIRKYLEIFFCIKGTMNVYKLQLFNKIEVIIYIEYSIIMKVCFTLHFFNVFKDFYMPKKCTLFGASGIFFLQRKQFLLCYQTKCKINDKY
jgi:hypothetical protein